MHNSNFTVLVNWKEKGFGCAKACTYCNWRNSPLLPQGAQSPEDVSAFISQCKKSFITISGGGDPLYRFEENRDKLLSMANTIKAHGFKVRIITREVQHIEKLKGIADHVSISLDDDVLEAIEDNRYNWDGIDIEFSLVLPPLPLSKLVALKPQYLALRVLLGSRLVLRENVNSIFPVDPRQMSFGHQGIVFVPKSLCLNGRYLSTVDTAGHAIVQDMAPLADFLMNHDDVFLFGGIVKHLMNPAVHLEYSDIDVVALKSEVMDDLVDKFDFSFRKILSDHSYPRYFLGKSLRAGKNIQLVLMDTEADAKRFIFNSQYTVDRIYYRRGFQFDPAIGNAEICNAINTKTATLVPGQRQKDLFHPSRDLIEQRHKSKLLKKGYAFA